MPPPEGPPDMPPPGGPPVDGIHKILDKDLLSTTIHKILDKDLLSMTIHRILDKDLLSTTIHRILDKDLLSTTIHRILDEDLLSTTIHRILDEDLLSTTIHDLTTRTSCRRLSTESRRRLSWARVSQRPKPPVNRPQKRLSNVRSINDYENAIRGIVKWQRTTKQISYESVVAIAISKSSIYEEMMEEAQEWENLMKLVAGSGKGLSGIIESTKR